MTSSEPLDPTIAQDETILADCSCLRCSQARADQSEDVVIILGMRFPLEATRMFVCAICGNKRCPHSDDHRNACTNSNDPGQPGSRYA